MVKAPHRAGDPTAGRLVVITAGALGLAGLVGYGVMQVKQRREARAAADRVQVAPPSTAPTPRDLVTQARRARLNLDTAALTEIDAALATAANETTSAPKALETQRERLAVLSSLAVEAAVRASLLGDDAARQRAHDWAADGRSLVDQLKEQLDPGETTATRARLALAAGDDATFVHPSVLLPAFRDRELQHVILAQPLWSADAAEEASASASADDELPSDDDALDGLVAALEQLRDPSGMERLMLAIVLEDRGQSTRARTVVEAVLSSAPNQPLAAALRDRLHNDALVAVAEPSVESRSPEITLLSDDAPDASAADDSTSPKPTLSEPASSEPASPNPAPSEPAPSEPASPRPAPSEPAAPEPASSEPVPSAPAIPEPTPPKSTPSEPAAPETTPPDSTSSGSESTKPKPKPGSASKRKTPAELTEEGCKLVRGKDPKKGFSMLQRAFDLNPRDPNVTLCMAEAHMKLGRLPSARAMIERVLGKSSRNKRALLLAAKIEDKLNNPRTALDYYRQVLELDPNNRTAQSYIEAHS